MLNPIKNRKLLKRGVPVRARIREMSTRPPGRDCHATVMTLEVDLRGDTYALRDRFMIAGDEPIKVGSEIWLVVDPHDRRKVAIAWERTREEHHARTAKRREQANLPAPAPKARDLTMGTPMTFTTIPQEFKGTQTLEPIPTVMIGAYGTDGEPPPPAAGPTQHERDLIAEHPQAPAPLRPPLAAVPDPTPIRPAVPPARPAPPPQAAGDLTSKLERLASLRDAGALTEVEFAVAKAQVLSGDVASSSSSTPRLTPLASGRWPTYPPADT